jgi:cell division protein FtsB
MSHEELKAENARLKAEVERLKEGNECLDQMHEKEMARSAFLCEEVNRTTAWGRGLESDLSWARAELLMVKAEVERLTEGHSTDFVRAEMYRHLLDENAKLKEEVMRMRNDDYKEGDILQKCCEHQKNRIERLKAEVERLTKAGDELHIFLISYIVKGRISSSYLNELDDNWNAAKEGKQP